MKKLLVCVDGSTYADNITTHAAWAAKRLNAEIDLLHVLRRHSDYQAPHEDHTGAIGLGARSNLMDELAKVDEERGRLDQQKGWLILEHSQEELKKAGIEHVNTIHRRGSLVGTIQELEPTVDMIFIGKRGEQADPESEFLGSNLEKVVRSVHKPVFLVSHYVRTINKFLIAYDGKDNANQAVEFACTSKLLQGLECHLLSIGHDLSDAALTAGKKLETSGYRVISHIEDEGHVDELIASYVTEMEIDLLLTGAYSHSRMRTMLLGSTTAKLIKQCDIPVILFR
ncbi:MAG: universal stress protein [Waddliaceae bacterium]